MTTDECAEYVLRCSEPGSQGVAKHFPAFAEFTRQLASAYLAGQVVVRDYIEAHDHYAPFGADIEERIAVTERKNKAEAALRALASGSMATPARNPG